MNASTSVRPVFLFRFFAVRRAENLDDLRVGQRKAVERAVRPSADLGFAAAPELQMEPLAILVQRQVGALPLVREEVHLHSWRNLVENLAGRVANGQLEMLRRHLGR